MQLIIYYAKHEFKSLKAWNSVLHINFAAYTRIASLNYWVFDIIFFLIQLS